MSFTRYQYYYTKNYQASQPQTQWTPQHWELPRDQAILSSRRLLLQGKQAQSARNQVADVYKKLGVHPLDTSQNLIATCIIEIHQLLRFNLPIKQLNLFELETLVSRPHLRISHVGSDSSQGNMVALNPEVLSLDLQANQALHIVFYCLPAINELAEGIIFQCLPHIFFDGSFQKVGVLGAISGVHSGHLPHDKSSCEQPFHFNHAHVFGQSHRLEFYKHDATGKFMKAVVKSYQIVAISPRCLIVYLAEDSVVKNTVLPQIHFFERGSQRADDDAQNNCQSHACPKYFPTVLHLQFEYVTIRLQSNARHKGQERRSSQLGNLNYYPIDYYCLITITQIQMGASESQPFMNELSEYRTIRKIPENNVTHLAHIETDKQYLLRQLTYNDEKLFRRNLQEHKLRQSISDDHLTHLGRVEGKEIDHLCSNLYKIYAIWEFPYRFLSDEINERSYQNRKFQDKQISSILASSIFALSTLQKNKVKHEMLTTRTILLDSDGLIKIADPLACGCPTNFDTIHRNRHAEQVYISPEQCQALELRGAYSNPYKSDVWVLGLIILECGLLESMSKCYKDEYQRIDFQTINTKVYQFGVDYGEELKLVLQHMLKQDNKDRPDWIDLAQYARKLRAPFLQPASKFSTENKQPSEQSYMKNNFSPSSNKQDNSSFLQNQLTIYQQNPNSDNNQSHLLRPSFDPPKAGFTQSASSNVVVHQSGSYRQPTLISSNNPPLLPNAPTYPSTNWPNVTTAPYINRIYSDSHPRFASSYRAQNESGTNYLSTFPGASMAHMQQLSAPVQISVPLSYSLNQGHLFSVPHSSAVEHQVKSYEWKPPAQGINSLENFKNGYEKLSMPSSQTVRPNSISAENGKSDTKFNNYNYMLKSETGCLNAPSYASYQFGTSLSSGVPKFSNPPSTASNESLFTPPSFLQSLHPLYKITNKEHDSIGALNAEVSKLKAVEQVKTETFHFANMENTPLTRQDVLDGKNKEHSSKVEGSMGIGPIITHEQSLEQHINTVESNHQNADAEQTQGEKRIAMSNEDQSGQIPEFVVQTFKQGSKYEGFKLKDMRHGQGKFYYQDGGMYDGEWKKNKMDGFGSLYYQSGELAYQGMWREDQFQGKGKLYNEYPYALEGSFDFTNFDQIDEYWSYYEGDFVQDFKKGNGILMLSNGQFIEGQFNNDMLEGPGIFHCKDGTIVRGVWRQNHLVST